MIRDSLQILYTLANVETQQVIQFVLSDLRVKEEVKEKPSLGPVRFANIMFYQELGKRLVLSVHIHCLAVIPWHRLVVYHRGDHFSVLVVLLAKRSSRSKVSNGVDSIQGCEKKPGNEKSVCSLFSKLPLRSTEESVEGGDTGEEEKHRHLPDVHEHHQADGKIVEGIVAPSDALYIVASDWGIDCRGVEEKNTPGQGNPDDVDA